jgi:hypothetical protein
MAAMHVRPTGSKTQLYLRQTHDALAVLPGKNPMTGMSSMAAGGA